MDELRISNSARYTANFTPSTQPFVNDVNTVLLIHADGTDASTFFEDDNGARSKKGIAANGNAQIDTAESKFGGSSALFDGSGDRLSYIRNDGIGTSGDFTFEAWVRVNGGNLPTVFADNISFFINNSGVISYFSGTTRTGTQTLTANQFSHCAWVRQSGTLNMYVNGVYADGFANSANMQDIEIYIGGYNDTNNYAGWLDEVRISKVARYTGTGNFTPPTAPFQNDADTILLLHMDGTDGSTVFVDDNGVTPTHQYS
jgi:hypothetical protein